MAQTAQSAGLSNPGAILLCGCLLVALSSVHCQTAVQPLQSSLGSRRQLLDNTSLCEATCPDISVCSSLGGAPVCQCPPGMHLLNDTCVSLPPTTALAATRTLTAKRIQYLWLDPINNARAAVGSPPLVWDDALAQRAQKWADTLTGTMRCALKHGDLKGVGQTLAGGSGNFPFSFGITDAVNLWVKEGAKWSYAKFDGRVSGCKTGRWIDCGHYIQVIWARTTKLGCGVSKCPLGAGRGSIWACDYSLPGNVFGQFPYVRSPCYKYSCPSPAVCNATSGVAVCQCPKGQALSKGHCIADPCKAHKCFGNQVCDGSSGLPRCICQPPQLPSSRGSTTCVDPQCLNVKCPSGSSCKTLHGAPFCTCTKGSALVGSNCTSSVRGTVITTSVALYNSGGYTNTPSALGPAVLRSAGPGSCVPIPTPFLGTIGSYQILWSPPDAGLPSGSSPGSSRTVFFWDGANCRGRAMGTPNSGRTMAASTSARGLFSTARAIQFK